LILLGLGLIFLETCTDTVVERFALVLADERTNEARLHPRA
jgi:hypothetical protein